MRAHHIRGVLIVLSIIVVAIIYHTTRRPQPEALHPDLQYARIRYQIEEIEEKRIALKRHSLLKFYGMLGVLVTMNACFLIIVSGYVRARLKTASVCQTQIGQHSIIPVHYKDLQRFYPIAVNLSLAEIEASVSTSHETAYQISRQMLADMTNYAHAISGKQTKFPIADPVTSLQALQPYISGTRTCADLIHNGTLAAGKTSDSGVFPGASSIPDVTRPQIRGDCRMAGQRQNPFHGLSDRRKCAGVQGARVCHRSAQASSGEPLLADRPP